MDRGSSAGRLAARSIYEAGTLVGRWPSVALPVARWRGHGEPLDTHTELVVEGFPRSSNSLTVALIRAAQPEGIRIAHHVHAPSHVLESVRRRLPTLVMIREPEDAVVELALLKPAITVAQALRGWVRFYGPLEGHRREFVVARAEEIPLHVGRVVDRLNERFGTDLLPPDVGPEDLARAEADTERYWTGRSGPGLPLIGRTEARDVGAVGGAGQAGEGADAADQAERRALHRAYAERRLTRLRSRAERLHETLTGGLPDLG